MNLAVPKVILLAQFPSWPPPCIVSHSPHEIRTCGDSLLCDCIHYPLAMTTRRAGGLVLPHSACTFSSSVSLSCFFMLGGCLCWDESSHSALSHKQRVALKDDKIVFFHWQMCTAFGGFFRLSNTLTILPGHWMEIEIHRPFARGQNARWKRLFKNIITEVFLKQGHVWQQW